MYLRQSLILFIAALLSVPSIAARTERALLIGLGKQKDPAWERINGDRDVAILSSRLFELGVTDIRTLTNQSATKKGIVAALKSIASASAPGDLVYIHFSGHGQRMTDIGGDEGDRLDEAWIPYDAYRAYCPKDRGEKHLSDDELARLFTRIADRIGPEGRLIVVADACHSGDSSRGNSPSGIPVRGVMDDFIIPAVRPDGREARPSVRWTLLSACKDYQLNFEHPLGYGLLTYTMYELWSELAKLSDNRAILRSITSKMRSSAGPGQPQQTPVLETNATDALAPLFKLGH